MLSAVADVLQLSSVGPWVAAAAVLLVLALRLARSARASAQRQGERIGNLERGLDSERTRRQQTEATLCGLGVPLPFWPPDGQGQPRPTRPVPRRLEELPADDDDQADDDDATYTRERPSVPPLDFPAAARHRRG